MTDDRVASVYFSFNEVEALGVKAARGAGLGWGHAEDLGRVARWLAEQNLDWASPLLRLLDDERAASQSMTLASAADRAAGATAGDRWSVEDTTPALLIPMLAAAIFGTNVGLRIEWSGNVVDAAPDGSARLPAGPVDLNSAATLRIAIEPGVVGSSGGATRARPAPLPVDDLDRLSAYASRTAVPASEASRIRGAGSAGSDND